MTRVQLGYGRSPGALLSQMFWEQDIALQTLGLYLFYPATLAARGHIGDDDELRPVADGVGGLVALAPRLYARRR